MRVLVIEDNEDDRELLLRQLTKSKMAEQVKFIADGREALDFLLQDKGGLVESLMVIFLDLKLPGVGGLEVLRRIRQTSHLRSIPVVVMTSSQDPADLEQCTALRVDNYVEKPVTFSAFSKAMADVFHSPKTSD